MKYELNRKRLRDIRHLQGKTLEDVSKDLHVSISRLSRYERGSQDIMVNFLMRLCNYYGVSVTDVIDVVFDEGEERVRDPKRIPEILSQLTLYWNNHPDLRLFQVFNNIGFDSKEDNFYVEDDDVLKRLLQANEVDEYERR